MHVVVALIMAMFLVNQAAAGAWTPNHFIYKPALGARGETEKSTFDSGLERVDAHLARYKTLGDPGYATLSEALTSIGSTETPLVIPAGQVSISATTTIPANVQLRLAKGGQFAVANGVTLTINGPFEAGPHQVFTWTGTGKVVFGSGAVEQVRPEWWGAKADGATDCDTAFQAAVNAFPRVRLTEGAYKIDNATVYLNSTDSQAQFVLQGAGRATILDIANLTGGSYAFKVNEDAGGAKVATFPRHWRAVFRDMTINAANSSGHPNFLKVTETGALLENLNLRNFTNGVVTSGYCDISTLRNIVWDNSYPGGYLYTQTSNGDGVRLEQIFCNDSGNNGNGLCKATAAMGITLQDCLGGLAEFTECLNVVIDNWHNEQGNGAANTNYITIRNSYVTIRNSYFWDNRGVYPIVVNDYADSYRSTRLVLENNIFDHFLTASGTAQKVMPALSVTAINDRSRLIFKNNRGAYRVSGSYSVAPNGWIARSDNSTLSTAFSDYKHLLQGECEAYHSNEGAASWKIRPLGNAVRQFTATAGTPSFPWIATQSVVSYSNLAAGAYYYKVATYSDLAHTAASAASGPHTTTQANQHIGMDVDALLWPNTFLRIWRSTDGSNWTRYADIPLSSSKIRLLDLGSTISGWEWQTSGIPAPPADNTTMAGQVMPNGKRIFWAAAAPTSAEFTAVLGDIIWKTSPTAGTNPGWMCTTAGSPGTWKAMGNLAN